ncbi:MAG TPA: MarR family transcriptional regulator [Gammaproteobacteria bacterium]|nr:MarR family transcriptional regulator [Gammaproteobacteria bacterium]
MATDMREIHDLIERLGNLVRADVRAVCNEYGMRPVQLEALRFLTQCNRYSDTPQAVTEFLGLTKGTVSQTLKVLEQKGLLRKQGDAADKRLVHLKPTSKGRRLVERAAPAKSLVPGLKRLAGTESQAVKKALCDLLYSIQEMNGFKTFAPCHTCRFNQRHDGQYFCGLTQEPLSDRDVLLICREHQYPVTAGAK